MKSRTAPARSEPAAARPPRRRLALLLTAGIILCGAAVALRVSPWARDRYLQRLSGHSLSLLALERPNDARVHEELGKRLSAEGDIPGSLQAFQRAVELNPKLADAQLGLGVALMRAGQPHAAERCLVAAAELRPRDPTPHFNLAELYGRYRNATATIPPLEKVTELDPRDAEAWYRLGLASGDLHQWDRSLSSLERAVRLNGRRAEYLRDLAQVQMHFGKSGEARESLLRAREIDPTDPAVPVLLARTELAQGSSEEQLKRARELLDAALALQPGFAAAHREMGTVHLRRGDVPAAIASLRRAVRADSSDGQALFQLGQALLRAGRRQEGEYYVRGFRELTEARRTVAELEDRIHQDPKNPVLRLRMARTYRRYGRSDRAVNQYQVYLTLNAEDEAVQKELRSYAASLPSGPSQPAGPGRGK